MPINEIGIFIYLQMYFLCLLICLCGCPSSIYQNSWILILKTQKNNLSIAPIPNFYIFTNTLFSLSFDLSTTLITIFCKRICIFLQLKGEKIIVYWFSSQKIKLFTNLAPFQQSRRHFGEVVICQRTHCRQSLTSCAT